MMPARGWLFVPCYWWMGASDKQHVTWNCINWPIENNVSQMNYSEGAVWHAHKISVIKICIGRLYKVSGPWVYPQHTFTATWTCSSHGDTVLYETYEVSQRNQDVHTTYQICIIVHQWNPNQCWNHPVRSQVGRWCHCIFYWIMRESLSIKLSKRTCTHVPKEMCRYILLRCTANISITSCPNSTWSIKFWVEMNSTVLQCCNVAMLQSLCGCNASMNDLNGVLHP